MTTTNGTTTARTGEATPVRIPDLAVLRAAPLYQLEAAAWFDSDAKRECGRRYAERVAPEKSAAHRARLETAYVLGLAGEPNPYAHGRGGNYAKPLWRAYRAGAKLRAELQEVDPAELARAAAKVLGDVPAAAGAR